MDFKNYTTEAMNSSFTADFNTESKDQKVVGMYQGLLDFSASFGMIHSYACFILCIVGLLTNSFNVYILNQRQLRSLSNLILTMMALCDSVTMALYIPFLVHSYFLYSEVVPLSQHFSFGWAIFNLMMTNITITSHNISVWLGVALAIFRYIQCKSKLPKAALKVREKIQGTVLIIPAVLVSIALSIPYMLTNGIEKYQVYPNETIYIASIKNAMLDDSNVLRNSAFIIYAICGKLIPCVLMILYLGALACRLKNRDKRRRSMTSLQRNAGIWKSNRILYTILALFLVTEFPQGILVLLCVFIPGLFANIYLPLGDFFDFLVLINCSVNFMLYCFMNGKFRSAFMNIFCLCKRSTKRTTGPSCLLTVTFGNDTTRKSVETIVADVSDWKECEI